MFSRSWIVVPTLISAPLVACGDNMPESEAAKQVGNISTQTLNKVQSDLDPAARKYAERMHDADDRTQ
jgi:hypothetical protein